MHQTYEFISVRVCKVKESWFDRVDSLSNTGENLKAEAVACKQKEKLCSRASRDLRK
jgi:hypothetical protein